MKKVTFYFSECEHEGDLENYKSDVISSGGNILTSYVNDEDEEGIVLAEIEPSFWDKFKKTDSYNFCENR